jgi:hypothetical protein
MELEYIDCLSFFEKMENADMTMAASFKSKAPYKFELFMLYLAKSSNKILKTFFQLFISVPTVSKNG